MKNVFIASLAATAAFASAAQAQTAEFKCPAAGTEFTVVSAGVESKMVAGGQEGTVCLGKSTSGGNTRDLRTHYGVIGSVDAAGESYAKGIDLAPLWPLKVGNKVQATVNGVGYNGQPYTAVVAIAVAAYEKVTVPAGTFDAYRIEEHKVGEATPHIHWWAPAVSSSIKQTFADWRDRSKLATYELAAVKK